MHTIYMLKLPAEKERIEDSRVVRNIDKILQSMKNIMESSEVAQRVDREFHKKKGHRDYFFVQLFLSYAYMFLMKLKFDDVRFVMKESICEIIGLPHYKGGSWMIPSGSTLCEFKRDTLDPVIDELISEFMKSALSRSKMVMRTERYVVLTLDSTPIQASRYNFDAEYNGHYRIRMDKMHIFMMDGIPLLMIYTGGNVGDTDPVPAMAECLGEALTDVQFDRSKIKCMTDGGYDSFDIYADMWYHTGCLQRCHIREGAVYHDEASWINIQKKYTSMYRCPEFDPMRKNDEDFVLHFLYKNGQKTLVGKYLRNKALEFQKSQTGKDTDREICESRHHTMKSWLNMTTVKLRHATRSSVMRAKFFVCQLMSAIMASFVELDEA